MQSAHDRDEEELARTAYHEAGHCVMAVLAGATTHVASIAPEEDGFYGKVTIEWPTRHQSIDVIAAILAGPIAEMIYRGEPLHPGFVPEWSLDWQQAWNLARPKFRTDQACLAALEQLVRELYQRMSQPEYWSAIAAVQDLLSAHEEIEHEQIAYEVQVWLGS